MTFGHPWLHLLSTARVLRVSPFPPSPAIVFPVAFHSSVLSMPLIPLVLFICRALRFRLQAHDAALCERLASDYLQVVQSTADIVRLTAKCPATGSKENTPAGCRLPAWGGRPRAEGTGGRVPARAGVRKSDMDPVLVQELVTARRVDDPLGELTGREREVLALMAEGRSNAGIGQALYVTEGTVEKHVRSIMMKLRLTESSEVHRRVLAVLAFLDAH